MCFPTYAAKQDVTKNAIEPVALDAATSNKNKLTTKISSLVSLTIRYDVEGD